MNRSKILLKIILTAFLAWLLQIMLPWWSVAVAGLAIGFIVYTRGFTSFLTGFLGVGILWFSLAMIIDIQTGSILTSRVAAIFSLPYNWLLILVTSVIGGIAGGFGALTGSHLRSWIMPPQ